MSMAEAIPEAEFFGDTPALTESSKPAGRGRRGRVGDLVLKVIAWGVILYLFIPLFVIVLFSFNEPVGKFNLTWHGFSLEAWQRPVQVPAAHRRAQGQPRGRGHLDGHRHGPGHLHRHRPRAPAVPRQRGR